MVGGLAARNRISLIYATQRLKAAEPGVAPATARQLLVGARHIPTKRHPTLRSPPVFWEPRPTNSCFAPFYLCVRFHPVFHHHANPR